MTHLLPILLVLGLHYQASMSEAEAIVCAKDWLARAGIGNDDETATVTKASLTGVDVTLGADTVVIGSRSKRVFAYTRLGATAVPDYDENVNADPPTSERIVDLATQHLDLDARTKEWVVQYVYWHGENAPPFGMLPHARACGRVRFVPEEERETWVGIGNGLDVFVAYPSGRLLGYQLTDGASLATAQSTISEDEARAIADAELRRMPNFRETKEQTWTMVVAALLPDCLVRWTVPVKNFLAEWPDGRLVGQPIYSVGGKTSPQVFVGVHRETGEVVRNTWPY